MATLTQSDFGKVVTLNTAMAAITATLPAIGTNPIARSTLKLVNIGTNAVTVTRNGTDTINYFGGNVNSFTLPASSTVELCVSATNLWLVVAISSNVGVATTSKAGIVKPDGSSISVAADGTISASASGSQSTGGYFKMKGKRGNSNFSLFNSTIDALISTNESNIWFRQGTSIYLNTALQSNARSIIGTRVGNYIPFYTGATPVTARFINLTNNVLVNCPALSLWSTNGNLGSNIIGATDGTNIYGVGTFQNYDTQGSYYSGLVIFSSSNVYKITLTDYVGTGLMPVMIDAIYSNGVFKFLIGILGQSVTNEYRWNVGATTITKTRTFTINLNSQSNVYQIPYYVVGDTNAYPTILFDMGYVQGGSTPNTTLTVTNIPLGYTIFNGTTTFIFNLSQGSGVYYSLVSNDNFLTYTKIYQPYLFSNQDVDYASSKVYGAFTSTGYDYLFYPTQSDL